MREMFIPEASRVVRKGRWRWEAWCLFPHPEGPWFLVGRAFTRAGALRQNRVFIRSLERKRDRTP